MTTIKALSPSQEWRLRPRERQPFLLVGDLVVSTLSLLLALYIWGLSSKEWLGLSSEFFTTRVPFWFYLLPLIWLGLMVELYDIRRAGNIIATARGVAVSALLGLGLYLLIYFTSSPNSLPRGGVAYFLIGVSILTLVWRILYIRVFTTSAFMRRALIVGGGKAGRTLLQIYNAMEPPPFLVAGVIDDDPNKSGTDIESYRVLGGAERLPKIIEEENVSDLIVCISGEIGGRTFQTLLDLQERGLEIVRMQTVYEELLGRVPIFHLEADWILRNFVEASRVSAFYLLTKRFLDLLVGILGLLALAIVFPFVALANLLESGLPIFYTQTRSGQSDRSYELIKFRTMWQDAEKDGTPQWTKENDERVTRVGRILRKTHLDELPQCLNILRGEMSIVGPRPERPELIALFQKHVPFYRARLLVKPGLTGWAQVHQDYAANVEETNMKLEYDLYYIKHRSLLLDLIIMLRTPATVLGFRGR
ncbi:MAG TPA: sugar transferase [Anaerolineales bacterium]|nr:sugar transferase [Anaerolineales bacterium]